MLREACQVRRSPAGGRLQQGAGEEGLVAPLALLPAVLPLNALALAAPPVPAAVRGDGRERIGGEALYARAGPLRPGRVAARAGARRPAADDDGRRDVRDRLVGPAVQRVLAVVGAPRADEDRDRPARDREIDTGADDADAVGGGAGAARAEDPERHVRPEEQPSGG